MPRKLAYADGLSHSAVTAPRSTGAPMIATRMGKPACAADASRLATSACCPVDMPDSEVTNRFW